MCVTDSIYIKVTFRGGAKGEGFAPPPPTQPDNILFPIEYQKLIIVFSSQINPTAPPTDPTSGN